MTTGFTMEVKNEAPGKTADALQSALNSMVRYQCDYGDIEIVAKLHLAALMALNSDVSRDSIEARNDQALRLMEAAVEFANFGKMSELTLGDIGETAAKMIEENFS